MNSFLTPWPPELDDDETILHAGAFDLNTWLKHNVLPVLVAITILSGFLIFSGRMAPAGIGYLCLLSALGILIAGLIYRRQKWQITNKAVYIRHRSPIPLRAIRKVRGFGGTLRFVQAWGMSTQVLGVKNASDIRKKLVTGAIA